MEKEEQEKLLVKAEPIRGDLNLNDKAAFKMRERPSLFALEESTPQRWISGHLILSKMPNETFSPCQKILGISSRKKQP